MISSVSDLHDSPPLDGMEDVFDRYVRPIYTFLYRRVGNREDAEDLTSEVFLKAAKELDARRSEASIASWLFTVARTTLADHWRRYSRYGSVLTFDDMIIHSTPERADDVAPSHETEQRVAQILSALPGNYRKVLELRFLSGLTIRETAQEMGVTPGNVKVMQHRALARALIQSNASAS